MWGARRKVDEGVNRASGGWSSSSKEFQDLETVYVLKGSRKGSNGRGGGTFE